MSIPMKKFCNIFNKSLAVKAPWIDKAKAWSRTVFPILSKMAVDEKLCCWTNRRFIRDKQLLDKIRKLNGLDTISGLQEYMVDMCWTKVDRRNWYSKRIEVAIECEWSSNEDELLWDFSKLLDLNATRKVFIYDSRLKKQKVIENSFKKSIKSYDSHRLFAGDQILLIDINRKGIKCTCFGIGRSKNIKQSFCIEKDWNSI